MPGNVPSDIKARDFPGKRGQRPLGPGSPPPSEAQQIPMAGQMLLPPSYYPPREAQFFYQRGRATALAAVAGPTVLAGSTFQIPANTVGWVREWSVQINNMLANTDIRFTILVNGGPVPGYTDFQPFPSPVARFSAFFFPEDTKIELPDRAQIQVLVTVLDPGVYDVGSDYRGWFISKSVANRYPQW